MRKNSLRERRRRGWAAAASRLPRWLLGSGLAKSRARPREAVKSAAGRGGSAPGLSSYREKLVATPETATEKNSGQSQESACPPRRPPRKTRGWREKAGLRRATSDLSSPKVSTEKNSWMPGGRGRQRNSGGTLTFRGRSRPQKVVDDALEVVRRRPLTV